MIRPCVCSWLTMATLAFSGNAWASGLGTPLVGSGWSGVATADAAAVHFNPAMLASLSDYQLQLGASFVYGHVSYERERRALYQYEDGFRFALPLDEADIDYSKTGKAAAVKADVFMALGSVFAAWPILKDQLTIGLGVYAPYGVGVSLPDDGPQRFAAQEALILDVFISPAIAYKPVKWFQVGVGCNVIIGSLDLRQVIDLAATPMLAQALADPPLNQANDFGSDAPPGVRELDVLGREATVTSMAYGVAFNIGLTFHPDEDWTIGITYQHGADLTFKGDISLDMNHDFFTKDLAFKGLQFPPLVRGTAWVEFPLPAAVRLGVAWQAMPELELSLQANYVMWSVVEALDITIQSPDLAQPELGMGPVTKISLPRRFMDTIEADLTLGYQLDEDIRLGGRLGYHSPYSPDETMDISGIDGHRLTVRLLIDYKVSDLVTIQGHAVLHQVLPREVLASDYDRGNGTYALTMLAIGGTLDFTL